MNGVSKSREENNTRKNEGIINIKTGKPLSKEEIEKMKEELINSVREISKEAEEYEKYFASETSESSKEAEEYEEYEEYLDSETSESSKEAEEYEEYEEYLDSETSGSFEKYSEEEIAEADASMREILDIDTDRIFKDTSDKALNQKELDRLIQVANVEEQIKLVRKAKNKLKNARRMRTLKINIAMGKDIIKTLLKDTAKKYGSRAEKYAKDNLERNMLDKKWEEAIIKINNTWHEEQEQGKKELEQLQTIESTIQNELSNYINDRETITGKKEQILQSIEMKRAEMISSNDEIIKAAAAEAMFGNDAMYQQLTAKFHREFGDYKRKLAKEHNVDSIDAAIEAYDKEIEPINIKIEERRRELEKARKDREDCENRINERDAQMSTDMKEARENIKISKLTLPKRNILQKIVGSVINRFGGKKKFVKDVIEDIQSIIDKLENEGVEKAKNEVIRLSEERQKREEEYYVKYAGDGKSWRVRKEESREIAEQKIDKKIELRQANAQKRKDEKLKNLTEALAEEIKLSMRPKAQVVLE